METNAQKPNKKYFKESVQVIGVAFELGFIIALPLVALALGGKWLDQREHTGFYLYIGIVLAIFISSAWMFSRFKAMVETLRKAADAQKNLQNKERIEKEQK